MNFQVISNLNPSASCLSIRYFKLVLIDKSNYRNSVKVERKMHQKTITMKINNRVN